MADAETLNLYAHCDREAKKLNLSIKIDSDNIMVYKGDTLLTSKRQVNQLRAFLEGYACGVNG